MQLFLTTSGSPTVVVIPDLGNVTFAHPVVSAPLIIPQGQFTLEEIQDSADLQTALTGGEVTIVDQQGTSITTLATQADVDAYVKVSLADTTPGTLQNKIDTGGSIIGTITTPGGDEQISFNVNPANPIDAADIAYDDTAAPVGSPTEGETTMQGAIDAVNTQTNTNTTDITDIQNDYGAANGLATLNASGVIPNSQLPNLAISDVFTAADIPARDTLAASWGVDEEGDTVIVTDAGDDPNVPSGESATYLWDGSAFQRIVSGNNVTSVNGETGVVVLTADEIGATAGAAGTPTAGATDVQAQLDALNSATDALQDDSHVPAVSGNDAIDVVAGTQAISLVLDTTTGGGDNLAVINAGEGLYISPTAGTDSDSIYFGLRGNQSNSIYLRTSGGRGDFSNVNPIRIGYNLNIVRVDAFNRTANTNGWDCEVYINGSLSGTLTTTVTGGTSYATNAPGTPVAVTAGQTIAARFVNTSGDITGPMAIIHYEIA